MITGDFNVTLNPMDRSNQQHTMHEMTQFRNVVSSLELMDLQLQGREYTWSNERETPSFVRLDRFLISTHWANIFPNSIQKALPNASSDHCPLICSCETKFPCPNSFKIENYWLKLTEFRDLVKDCWQQTPQAQNPQELHNKLIKLRKKMLPGKRKKNKKTRSKCNYA
jgi:hypothetical protein